MHAPGGAEEDPAVGGDGRCPLEEVVEDRLPRLARVGSLNGLRQLHLVPDQDQVAGREPHRHHVGQRHLPRLVHEEEIERLVELLAGEEPGGPRDQVGRGIDRAVAGHVPDEAPGKPGLLVGGALFDSAEAEAGLDRPAFHRRQEVVDRLVGIGRHPHPPPRPQQLHDDVGRRVGLARPRGTLDEEIAVVQAAHGVDSPGERFLRAREHRGAGSGSRPSSDATAR